MPYDDPTLKEFAGYFKAKEPGRRERAENWAIAIGLQKVDGLVPSHYLVSVAKRHIEGVFPHAGSVREVNLASERWGGLGNRVLTRHYDAYGRNVGYSVNGARKTTIGYDFATGRIAMMYEGGNFAWQYLAGSHLKSRVSYPTVYNGKETLCKVCDGQTIVVPFRVVHTAKEVDAQPEIPTMKILFVDTGGCLWLSGHVGSDKFWWKYLAGRYNCPNDMLLCKVSLADGKITPIIMRDDNDNVFLAPEQDDFIENRSEGSRKFYFFSGLSRFLMQSHL